MDGEIKKMKNRAIICVFWDRNGHLRRYVEYYLQHLKRISQRLIVVINGDITLESEQILKNLGLEYYCRENKGLDFGGYKYGIEKIGYNNLYKYDDLILTNTTCYGPVYPLEEMFEAMDKKDCDFWGITEHPQTRKIKKHLQSYFLVFRNSIIKSETFQKYWKNLPIISDYKKVVEKLETKLTLYFENFGYQYLAYIPTPEKFNLNPMLITNTLLLKNRLPLVKRKAICGAFEDYIGNGSINYSNQVINCISKYCKYDLNMIFEDLLSTQPASEIQQSLGLNWILPGKASVINQKKSVALILHIYYPDLVEYCLRYAQSMPENADIYIVTSREDTKKICEEKMHSFKCNYYEIRLKPNRGRDVSAYLVTCRDVFKKYDYICCMHDKKTPQAKNPLSGKILSDNCFDSCLCNQTYVFEVLNLFEKYPYLGLCCPLIPTTLDYYKYINNRIGDSNIENYKKIYDEFNLSAPFDLFPIVPFGNMFWVRGNAMKVLLKKAWKYEDFEEEPLAGDGTIAHALERIYSIFVQEAGYYSGYITSIHQISTQISLLYLHIRKLTNKLMIYKKRYSFLSEFFSVKNRFINGKKIKQLTILGFKTRIREVHS